MEVLLRLKQTDIILVKIADLDAKLQEVQMVEAVVEEQVSELKLELSGLRIQVDILIQKLEKKCRKS